MIDSISSNTSWLNQAGQAAASSMRQRMLDKMFNKADSNGDGSISQDEFTAMFSKIKARMHQADGAGNMPTAADLFKQIDTDGNGSISKEELGAFMDKMKAQRMQAEGAGNASSVADLFKQADTNGDGTISKDEFSAMMDKMKQTHHGHHHHRAGGSGGSEGGGKSPLDALLAALSNTNDSSGAAPTSLADILGSTGASLSGSTDTGGGSSMADILARSNPSLLAQLLQSQNGAFLDKIA
jgi:Ca2+-binding EF-hand superfamily protein